MANKGYMSVINFHLMRIYESLMYTLRLVTVA
jgi:hypothetical protein